jgi:UDP-N-acetyl-D-glucosamine dehydrogenase
MKKVCVLGLGYVGLPISMAAAAVGYQVIGFDTHCQKVKDLNLGKTSVEGVDDKELLHLISKGNFRVTCNETELSEAEIFLICVPTPISGDFKPDFSYLDNAAKIISKKLKKGALVILESTVEPGTTRDHLLPLLEQESGLDSKDINLVFSPERIDPGNKKWNLISTPKIVAGLSSEAFELAEEFYSKFIKKIVKCNSLETAEMAKLLENTFRYVNISFINEFARICRELGIDVNEVIQAAATKPYGFMSFHPSIGAGGHCIPVDPFYLSNRAAKVGAPARFIELSKSVNQDTPLYFANLAKEKLGSLKDKHILVIGVSYKPNVSDLRESPVKVLIEELRIMGANISWHDELVREWNGEKSAPLNGDYDLAILATPHDYLNLDQLGATPILNTRSSI